MDIHTALALLKRLLDDVPRLKRWPPIIEIKN